MKAFQQREVREAKAYAMAGGQALHVCSSAAFVNARSPGCFRRSDQFAHLFDQDYERMMATARKFGVRVLAPEHVGTDRQHIDLCGKPLERALGQCDAADRWDKQQAQAEEKMRAQILLPLTVEQLACAPATK